MSLRDIKLGFGEDIVAEEITQSLNNFITINKIDDFGANVERKTFKKYSIFAPLSRQEKAVDLILFNRLTNKVLTIQVKSSKTYRNTDNKKGQNVFNHTWFNVFPITDDAKADLYALVTMYWDYESIKKDSSLKDVAYKPLILLFTLEEMKNEFRGLRRTRGGKVDKTFGHQFTTPDSIVLKRGFDGNNTLDSGNPNRSKYLLKNRIEDIKKLLE